MLCPPRLASWPLGPKSCTLNTLKEGCDRRALGQTQHVAFFHCQPASASASKAMRQKCVVTPRATPKISYLAAPLRQTCTRPAPLTPHYARLVCCTMYPPTHSTIAAQYIHTYLPTYIVCALLGARWYNTELRCYQKRKKAIYNPCPGQGVRGSAPSLIRHKRQPS